MKKILLFIVWILWIGFTFADSYIYYSWSSLIPLYSWDNKVFINLASTYISKYNDYWDFNEYQISPYINIHYLDEDNQTLVESYNIQDLYLDWKYKKTYTWWLDNNWVLTPVYEWSRSWSFVFVSLTWETETLSWWYEFTWNVFENFGDNMFQVIFWNIKWYFQYIIIFWIIMLIVWLVRRMKKM